MVSAMAGISPRLNQGAHQEQRLSARLLPSLTILELPAFELSTYLRDAFESNEALTLEEPHGSVEAPPSAETPADAARSEGYDGDAERDDFSAPRRAPGSSEASDRHSEWLNSQPAPEARLADRLVEQLAFLDFSGPRQEAWVRHLVDEVDERGLLTQDDDALLMGVRSAGILERFPLEHELTEDGEPFDQDAALADAVAVLHRLEPAGVGARNAIEALLLQLDPSDPDLALLETLLIDFLEELSTNKLPSVAAAMGLELDELGRLLGRLADVGSPLASASTATAPAIHPEVLVEEGQDGFSVRVDGAAWPKVGVDEDLRGLARGGDSGLKSYLRGKLDQARWIVDAVEQRKTTLLRVARAVFAHQRPFLEHGPGHLVPLRMSEVAELIGVHRSTVSRAVAGKYVWTPWGVFALKHFFQASAGEPGGGGGAARVDVRELVRCVVAEEDKRSPLSDEEIVVAMAARGYQLARRTVAKYRRELGLPSSYQRRDYLGS